MKLFTIFATRNDGEEAMELVAARDEYTVHCNPESYQASLKAIEADPAWALVRVIELIVPDEDLRAAFSTPQINAKVEKK